MDVLEILRLLWAGFFTFGAGPIDVGSTAPALLSAETCRTCHVEEYDQWRGSRHAAAWTNGLFQHDYRRAPKAWCRNCHIPLVEQQADRGGALAAEGVSCAVCHVRDGRIHARTRNPGSPHDTVVKADFGSAAFCAGCHQFTFPVLGDGGALAHYTTEPMQDTVAQFFANGRRPASCLGCHGGGHRFPGAHDPAMLEQALSLDLCRSLPEEIVVSVANVGAGHNVPTGDVHRHIVARAWRSTAPASYREAYFGRRFEPSDDGGKQTIWDSTLAPGERRDWRLALATLDGDADEPVNVELRYVYAADEAADVGEDPAYRTVTRVRTRPGDLAPCVTGPAPAPAPRPVARSSRR